MEDYWAELNTLKLSDNDATTIQAQANPTHIEARNIDRLASIKLVNDASMRDGSPIPGTGVVQQVSATTSAEKTLIHTPNAGEVWNIEFIALESAAGGSGNIIHSLFISPVEYGGSQPFLLILQQTNSSVPRTLVGFTVGRDNWADGPITYDENVSVYYSAERTSLTNATILIHRYRIR